MGGVKNILWAVFLQFLQRNVAPEETVELKGDQS